MGNIIALPSRIVSYRVIELLEKRSAVIIVVGPPPFSLNYDRRDKRAERNNTLT